MIDGQEGVIVDQTASRTQRLIMMRGSVAPGLTDVSKITRAWLPGGEEFAVTWDLTKALTPWMPPLSAEQKAD